MRLPILLLAMLFLFLTGCANAPVPVDGEGARCPLPRSTDGMFCSNIVRYARDPATGACCRYRSHCASPAGWKTYARKSACEEAGGSAE